jgi:hypothetical protein
MKRSIEQTLSVRSVTGRPAKAPGAYLPAVSTRYRMIRGYGS